MSEAPIKPVGLTKRQAEIWDLFWDLDLTREESVSALCGVVHGIETSMGQEVAEITASMITELRETRAAIAAAAEEGLDNGDTPE